MIYLKHKLIKNWWQATRYHFIPPSIFPVCIGALVSWARYNQLSIWFFFLVLFAVVVNHIALNMTDDYFDFKHAVDNLKPGEKNPYTGGSGVLTSSLIKPQQMFRCFILLYSITVIIGLYLVFTIDFIIIIFGLIGVFSSIFYTAPPIRFSHYGLGEIGMLINFGSVLGLGSFFVQAKMISWEAFFATLPCGIMLFSMIIVNEIPDIKEDTQSGKLTLIARYGPQFGIKLFIVSWIATYSVIILGMFLTILPIYLVFTLLSLPFVLRSIRGLKKHYDDPKLLAPANLDMIRSHSFVCLLILAGYSILGFLNNSNMFVLLGFFVIVCVFYIPAVVTTFRLK